DDRFRPFASRQEKQGAAVELLVEGYGDFLDTQCFVGCKRGDFRLPWVQLNQAQHPAEALPVSVQGLTVCGNRGVVGTPQLISPRGRGRNLPQEIVINLEVLLNDADIMNAWVYLASEPSNDAALRPYTWYKRFL